MWSTTAQRTNLNPKFRPQGISSASIRQVHGISHPSLSKKYSLDFENVFPDTTWAPFSCCLSRVSIRLLNPTCKLPFPHQHSLVSEPSGQGKLPSQGNLQLLPPLWPPSSDLRLLHHTKLRSGTIQPKDIHQSPATPGPVRSMAPPNTNYDRNTKEPNPPRWLKALPHKSTVNKRQGDMAPAKHSHPAAANPGDPNTTETQENNLKSNLTKMVEACKEEVDKFLKEMQETTIKLLASLKRKRASDTLSFHPLTRQSTPLSLPPSNCTPDIPSI